MKKLKFILFIFIFLGCEKVIDLETDFNDTRLVVDANISKHRDSLNAKASVKLSETVPYFSDEESIINDAIVSIEINQKTHELYYDNPTKLYLADINFIENNSDFVLLIEHKKNNYTSSSKLIKTPKIESVVFGDRKSLNKDEVELKVTFTDPPEEGNYYLWKFGPKKSGKFDYLPALDKYINGNKFTFSFFIDKTEYLQDSDYINIEINGITEDYFNYLNILTSQAGAQNGRPFSTSSSVIKGNVVNNTNLENFPLGYFRVYEFDYFRLYKENAPDGYFD
ncbi:MAG: DUF4249 domain-containing protein [Bacteroidota bacterium]|jgi:hypothetical protein